ncbi:MAG: hypothetical protein CVT66_06170 [Actinobacteria bacterium HGW-Actinobacteria-6]|nr:MAG: hypothetical protein CVT66_06170 [Actinobacteria bacterium HGW-Actinobacteria-6]
MSLMGLVGLLIAAGAAVGLALVLGRAFAGFEVEAPVPEVEPDVPAVDPSPGVWEQPTFSEVLPALPSRPSPMREPELRREPAIPLPPVHLETVMHRESWPPPGRVPPSLPKYEHHFRK